MATTDGTITSFTNTQKSYFQIDGVSYQNHTSGDNYSIASPDAHTLRFELRDGDHAWYDGSNVERTDIERIPRMSPGTPVNIGYQFMLEPGAANTADWFVTGEMHNDDEIAGTHTSPPFAVELNGEHLQIVARYAPTGVDPSNAAGNLKMLTLWTDPNPIQRGQYYDIQVQANFTNTSKGSLDVWINGKQVVNYDGPLGYGYPTYWVEGLYRSADASETVAGNYRNFSLTTGSFSAPPATTPTTPTSPTTPTNLAPTVTQASASPGTGVEHAGDTITMTLGFSEAVTVTGTPTLSLNDGGKATYVGGSGTSSLTFKTTVASTDKDTSALAVTGVDLPTGASIKDASGLAANLSGAVKTFSGLQINPILPAVTQATASPGTGTEHVGDAITLTLGFNEAVTVTGTPTLSLNDGGTATYVGGSGTGALTFKTTVSSTNTNTSALAITGVGLPSGASIKDASGFAANLSGAVKTFSGLQIDTATSTPPTNPTTPTAPTAPTTPPSSVTTPVVTIADNTLSVAGRGGTVDLGAKVTTTDTNDRVTVNITGLPRYETITDKLDGQTFRGNNITLTAAQVDSGLELHSYYRRGAHPEATLTLTASAKDPVTGAVASAAPQTITVTDPRPAATTTTTSPQTTTVTAPPSSTSASSGFPGGLGSAQQPHGDSVTSTAAPTAPQPVTVTDHPLATAAIAGLLANQGFALLQQHMDSVTSTLGTKSQAIATDPQLATGTTTASLANQSFALLNQYLAGHSGRGDSGQIVAAVSQVAGFGQEALLARPQH